MKVLKCASCGSNELTDYGAYVVCDFCRSRFTNTMEKVSGKATTIGLASDIDTLLKKCQEDQVNRRRYANLVLDIDPTNQQAKNYLL